MKTNSAYLLSPFDKLALQKSDQYLHYLINFIGSKTKQYRIGGGDDIQNKSAARAASFVSAGLTQMNHG